MAISAYAPHPAAARLFLEYMYSPTGQNLWIEGGAVPATITTMQKERHGEQGGRSRRPGASEAARHRDQRQATAAKALVVSDWASAVG